MSSLLSPEVTSPRHVPLFGPISAAAPAIKPELRRSLPMFSSFCNDGENQADRA